VIPDLGKYETVILSAYGATILLVAGLILLSWLRARNVHHQLRQMEERRRQKAQGSGKEQG